MEQNKTNSYLSRAAAWPVAIIMGIVMVLLAGIALMMVFAGVNGAVKETWKWLALMLPLSLIPGLLAWAAYKGMKDACVIARGPAEAGDAAQKECCPCAKLFPSILLLIALGGCGWFGFNKFAELKLKASEGATVGKLSSLRQNIQEYYGKTEGKFPADLKDIGQYMQPYNPEINFAFTVHHGRNGDVEYMSGKDYRAGKFTDDGGWAYVNTPGDKDWGMIVVNCTHRRYKRAEVWTEL